MLVFPIKHVGDLTLTLGILLTIGFIYDLSMASILSVASYLNGDLVLILTLFPLIHTTIPWVPSLSYFLEPTLEFN
jgi:hypothetical protein